MLDALINLLEAARRLVKNHVKLFNLEARLALRSIPLFLLYYGIFIIFCISTWLIFMFIVGYSIYQLNHNLIISAAIIVLINALVMVFFAYLAHIYFKQMQFNRTRYHFNNYKKQRHDKRSETTDKDDRSRDLSRSTNR